MRDSLPRESGDAGGFHRVHGGRTGSGRTGNGGQRTGAERRVGDFAASRIGNGHAAAAGAVRVSGRQATGSDTEAVATASGAGQRAGHGRSQRLCRHGDGCRWPCLAGSRVGAEPDQPRLFRQAVMRRRQAALGANHTVHDGDDRPFGGRPDRADEHRQEFLSARATFHHRQRASVRPNQQGWHRRRIGLFLSLGTFGHRLALGADSRRRQSGASRTDPRVRTAYR